MMEIQLISEICWFFKNWDNGQVQKMSCPGDETGCNSSNDPDLYLGGAQFKSWWGYHLS
jgi:hypothetical protein